MTQIGDEKRRKIERMWLVAIFVLMSVTVVAGILGAIAREGRRAQERLLEETKRALFADQARQRAEERDAVREGELEACAARLAAAAASRAGLEKDAHAAREAADAAGVRERAAAARVAELEAAAAAAESAAAALRLRAEAAEREVARLREDLQKVRNLFFFFSTEIHPLFKQNPRLTAFRSLHRRPRKMRTNNFRRARNRCFP